MQLMIPWRWNGCGCGGMADGWLKRERLYLFELTNTGLIHYIDSGLRVGCR